MSKEIDVEISHLRTMYDGGDPADINYLFITGDLPDFETKELEQVIKNYLESKRSQI